MTGYHTALFRHGFIGTAGPSPIVTARRRIQALIRYRAEDVAWNAILARGERVRRDAEAYAAQGLPARFADPRYGLTYLVSRDLDDPPDGWRVTTFRGRDPIGHYCARSAYAAFEEVLRGLPPDPNTHRGDHDMTAERVLELIAREFRAVGWPLPRGNCPLGGSSVPGAAVGR